MAGGANKKFKDLKEIFLRANLIDVMVSDTALIQVAEGNKSAKRVAAASTGRLANQGEAVNYSAKGRAAGIYQFDLQKSARTAQAKVNTVLVDMPLYELKAYGSRQGQFKDKTGGTTVYMTSKDSHPISAFWLPWSENSSWSVQLGPQADYFFTATMDGCSLAISSGATPVVTHANYKCKINPNVTVEGRTLRKIGKQHQTLGVDVDRELRRDTYTASAAKKLAGTNFQVTVIGFRDTKANDWSFYWQRRKIVLGDFQKGTPTQIILKDRAVPIV
jgi:hypothetical protein